MVRKPRRRRKNTFFVSKKSRYIAIALGTVAACIFISAAAVYGTNDVLPYAKKLESNINLGRHAGLFFNVEDYREALKSNPSLTKKETELAQAHQLAVQYDLVSPYDKTPENIKKFVSEFEKAPSSELHTHVTDKVCQQMINETSSALRNLNDYAASLNYDQDLDLKKRILLIESRISSTFDCRGTMEGNYHRADSMNVVLTSLKSFAEAKVPNLIKREVRESCLTYLKQPFDMTLMFKTEHLRLLGYLDIMNRNEKVSEDSFFYQKPKGFDMTTQIMLYLPRFQDAWKSKLHYSMAIAVNTIKKTQEDRLSIGFFRQDLNSSKASSELLKPLEADLGRYSLAFMRKENLLRKVDTPDCPH